MTNTPIPTSLRRAQHPARAIPCPHCRAATGQPCTVPATGRPLPNPHPSRTDAAAKARTAA
ncbi:hypothetical protein GA0115259_104223 [Streptomyces sp. MnatMP-M17]|nr:hypothetical protein GA0115259_104223 [Streptomyces sp. MnatMP-M17]